MTEIDNNKVNLHTINKHCKHFVLRKKRNCRMTVKSGYEYCGEHEPKTSTENSSLLNPRIRITCPLDNKHTCFANKLEKHLKKCNAKKTINEPYIIKNINIGEKYDETEITRALSNVSVTDILQVITKINKIYNNIIKTTITKKNLQHEILTEEINKTEYGPTTKKHLIQTSSIIGHLKEANLLQSNTCYVEFGAGKGQLSYWLSQVINTIEQSSVLLVERASLRHKFDNKLDKTKNCTYRIRADIGDLVLNKVEIVEKTGKIVGITKHLCGEATDLALRCLTNSMKENVTIQGLVMAFCCHHRCRWSNYVGQTFFTNNNLTKNDFDIICGLVSWATCGSGLSREARKKKIENNGNEQKRAEANYRSDEIGLTRGEREIIGKKCKLLIDYGRLFYLQEMNFSCNLFYYVEPEVTLENVCIVAEYKNNVN